jgi:hypothetical protein
MTCHRRAFHTLLKTWDMMESLVRRWYAGALYSVAVRGSPSVWQGEKLLWGGAQPQRSSRCPTAFHSHCKLCCSSRKGAGWCCSGLTME